MCLGRARNELPRAITVVLDAIALPCSPLLIHPYPLAVLRETHAAFFFDMIYMIYMIKKKLEFKSC